MALVWLRAYPTYEVLGLCFGLHKRVATDLAAVPEIVVEGETGFLVDAGDVRGLIEGLRTLVLDPELHGRMGRVARQHVERHYDASRNGDRIVSCLREAARV